MPVRNPILHFKAADDAVAMRKYLQRIRNSIPGSASFDLGPLEDAIAEFDNESIRFDAYTSSLKPTETGDTIREVNQKYLQLERQFCRDDAHLIYEFSAFYSDPPEFPRLYWSLESGDLEEAQIRNPVPTPFSIMLTNLRSGWISSGAGSELPLSSSSCESRCGPKAILD
jgi:hypothetical protein